MEQEIGIWDAVLLENLSEDNFINNLHQRYKRDHIYTYIGTSLVAVNPFRHLAQYSSEYVKAYGNNGIFQLPPHIYGLANLAYQSLKDQSEDQCIILSGESGSGKTESFRLIINFLTQIQEVTKPKLKSYCSKRRSSIATSASQINCNSGTTTPRHQSPVLNLINEKPYMTKARSESTDRASSHKKLSREKVVDFDFNRHKSSDNIPQHNYPLVMPKSCFKYNNIDGFCRSKTLTNVDYCVRKSNCDLAKNFSTNRKNNTTPYNNIKECCAGCIHNISELQGLSVNDYGKIMNQCKCASLMESTNLMNYSSNECIKKSSIETEVNKERSSNIILHPALKPKNETKTDSYSNSYKESGNNCCKLTCLAKEMPNSLVRNYSLTELYETNQRTESGKAFNVSSTLSYYQNSSSLKLRERITCCYAFLEAMGNAITVNNYNSSRYGKFIDIEIDFKGDPIGLHITYYLLERTRITERVLGERNFHIFYQILRGADTHFLKSLKLLRNVEKYDLLKNSIPTEDDKNNFINTKKSLNTLGLTQDEIASVFRVLAAVLKLGNFIFIPITNIDGTEGCLVSNDYELQETAQLLNVDAQILLHCLTKTSAIWKHEDNGSEFNAHQASVIRNILCRSLYGRLFTWLVNKINELLKSTQREKNLAILDFYGFESLEINLFEQLTINYCNEKIHQNFLNCVLKFEQELYVRDGLEWSKINFFDNEYICELIDKPNYGILNLINEPHINNDEEFFVRVQKCCSSHPNFLSTSTCLSSMCFRIRHFSGTVTYSVQGFLQKNFDNLPRSLSAGLFQSKMLLVQSLFPEGNPKRSFKTPISVSSTLRTQLQTLLSIIKNRKNHYVFCIKPNETKISKGFEMALVQHQVRCLSLMPLVNLYRNGYCFHMLHQKFFQRYKLLNNLTWPHFTHGSTIEGLALIIRSVPLPLAEFIIGTKNVFIRSPRTVYEMEEFRKAKLDDLAILIQKTFRMYFNRKIFLSMRNSQIVIASAWRTWRECRFGIPYKGRRHLWSLYRVAREEYRAIKYQKQVKWAANVIYRNHLKWRTRHFLLTLYNRLPPTTLSPLSLEWPTAPTFLEETSRILRSIYHRWRCYIYRKSFDQTSRNRMREKVTASLIFKDRKASYFKSVGHPFIGDYVRLRHNAQWKKYSMDSNDQYVVFADIINKITRSSGKFVPILLVISTTSMLILDQRTLQIKYRVPATEIYKFSLSPYFDDIAVFHFKADYCCAAQEEYSSESPTNCLYQSEFGRKKGDFVFQTGHVIEIVTKLFLVIQNATSKPPEVHISTEFEANFGQQTVIFTFKCDGMSDLVQGSSKVTRRGNRMEIIV